MSGGKKGSAPDWVPLMEAAIFLGVPVWDLERQPKHWRDRALVLKSVKGWAERERAELNKYHW